MQFRRNFMKLGFKTLSKLVKGACYCEKKNGYFVPYRYSKAQIEYMADESYDYGWRFRALFSGGIRLELRTDATELSFDYKASDKHERANTIDLYIDNVLTSVYTIGEHLKGKVEFTLPEGKKRVTIYYPCECRLEIKNFTINGSYKSVKAKGEKLLIIGDSITQGAGPQIGSASYLNTLTRRTSYDILGQGVGGYRYEAKDLMKIEGFEPDKLIVFLGTNYYEESCLERGYDYERAVIEFYERLNELYENKPVIAVTPLWRNNNVDMKRLRWCTSVIMSTCARYSNIKVIDGFDLVPNVDECFSDKVHPNAYGAEYLTTNLMKFMKEVKF
jgi:lysophospholipase L1-like esterase